VETDKIVTAETFWGTAERGHQFKDFSSYYRRQARRQLTLPDDVYPGLKIEAQINHGRWIVDCPFCKGAEYLWEGMKLFLCVSCLNNDTRLPIRVEVPKNKSAIEKILLERENPETRNWMPGETLADLKRENKENIIAPGEKKTTEKEGGE